MSNKSKQLSNTCSSITDAIGHSVVVGDYVTATWANAEVCLFKVSAVVLSQRLAYAMLERLSSTKAGNGIAGKSAGKPVHRTSNQITWIDPDWLCLHYLSK